jgi:hypothetical protein
VRICSIQGFSHLSFGREIFQLLTGCTSNPKLLELRRLSARNLHVAQGDIKEARQKANQFGVGCTPNGRGCHAHAQSSIMLSGHAAS